MTKEYIRTVGKALMERAEGVDIQCDFGKGCWEDLRDDELFRLLKEDGCIIRIKPPFATLKDGYRPFKDGEELLDKYCKRSGIGREAGQMPSVWIRAKNGQSAELMIAMYKFGVYFGHMEQSYKSLFECYTFLDGSPCGVKEAGE